MDSFSSRIALGNALSKYRLFVEMCFYRAAARRNNTVVIAVVLAMLSFRVAASALGSQIILLKPLVHFFRLHKSLQNDSHALFCFARSGVRGVKLVVCSALLTHNMMSSMCQFHQVRFHFRAASHDNFLCSRLSVNCRVTRDSCSAHFFFVVRAPKYHYPLMLSRTLLQMPVMQEASRCANLAGRDFAQHRVGSVSSRRFDLL